jgi:hypothetical protein
MQRTRKTKFSEYLAFMAAICLAVFSFALLRWSYGHLSLGWVLFWLGLTFLAVSIANFLAPVPWWSKRSAPTDNSEHTIVLPGSNGDTNRKS